MKNTLWTEKYRPTTLDGYVFVDPQQKQLIEDWVKQGSIPHLLLSGSAGVGKSALANVLINELEIEPYDVLMINASRENGVDIVRQRISSFVETIPFGKFKIVFLDEADATSPQFQMALRSDMETYSSTARFILTCNYPYKIIPAIKSRCHHLHITNTDINEFTARAATVLVAENIQFDLDTLDTFVKASYPDLRKCLGQLQVNSYSGSLILPVESAVNEDELLIKATQLFKSGKLFEGRQQLMHYIGVHPTRVEEVYKWMYQNLDLWGTTDDKRDASIIIIRNGLATLPMVGIPEIALAASLAELSLG